MIMCQGSKSPIIVRFVKCQVKQNWYNSLLSKTKAPVFTGALLFVTILDLIVAYFTAKLTVCSAAFQPDTTT